MIPFNLFNLLLWQKIVNMHCFIKKKKKRKALTDLDLAFFFSVQIRECPPTPIPRENDDWVPFLTEDRRDQIAAFIYLSMFLLFFFVSPACPLEFQNNQIKAFSHHFFIVRDQFNGLCSQMTHQNGIKLCKNSGYCQNGTFTAFVFCSRLIRLCNVPLLGLISAPGSTQMILILCGIF